ncbi:MAG: hypothetical protein ACFE9C_13485 [Candidatus Hodarchaeota archaeon]
MVKYYHCEKCKKIFHTETWIGEVHAYNGICTSCIAKEQQEDQIQLENVNDLPINHYDTEPNQRLEIDLEHIQSLPIEVEKSLLSGLEQKALDVLSGKNSINVLIKEIKDELIDKAKDRIEDTIQSFDASKIEAQKVVDYAEKTFDYLSEYKDYMDNVIKKLQDKPKMKVKTAIEKVFKETITNIHTDVPKDVVLNKKETIKNVFGKAVKWYNIYSDTEDIYELNKKMFLHPFNEIQKKLSTLPFYSSI